MNAPGPLHELSIAEAGRALRSGQLTSLALTEATLARIDALNPQLHAFVTLTRDRALADAAKADTAFARGLDAGPLQGIPYGLKDIYGTAGIRTTCHSHLLHDHIPEVDCAVEEKLRAGGGVLIGKLGTFEFAIGGPSFDLPFPPARNPWNPDHFTGGSSSGSAAAVASGMVRLAMGSDTGGSIRGPAALCGTVGFKPTYGRVSRRGVFPLAYSLDHCGPLTWSIEDAALTLQVIAGYDPRDPASADVPVPDYTAAMGRDLAGLRIGYTRRFFIDNPFLTPEVTKALDAAAEQMATLGATVDEVDIPAFEVFDACAQVIMFAEAYAIHETDLKTRPGAYGRYAYQRIVSGAVLSAADLVQAQRLRRELTTAVDMGALRTHHALLAPTGLSTAAPFSDFGKDAARWGGMLTNPFNVTGSPALALPIGFGSNGLPLGAQIVGRPFNEETVLRIGFAYEAASGVSRHRPPLDELSKAA
ncbi:amidase [Lichenifustis flavocetrariae]|uniref:Indoleacetamide hydrolase n=1 Tax=Lichenifustis flavocetrariae TaxID=2949735 RepID=A0AA42CLM5_9HYPH|nr:amidase [Lichenifustis flavocetrariae]MCW6507460.1 amidase family protein [Lichenifustis flavocetrariae]